MKFLKNPKDGPKWFYDKSSIVLTIVQEWIGENLKDNPESTRAFMTETDKKMADNYIQKMWAFCSENSIPNIIMYKGEKEIFTDEEKNEIRSLREKLAFKIHGCYLPYSRDSWWMEFKIKCLTRDPLFKDKLSYSEEIFLNEIFEFGDLKGGISNKQKDSITHIYQKVKNRIQCDMENFNKNQ